MSRIRCASSHRNQYDLGARQIILCLQNKQPQQPNTDLHNQLSHKLLATLLMILLSPLQINYPQHLRYTHNPQPTTTNTMTDDIDATVGAAHAAETDEMDAEPNEEHENIAAHIKEHTGNDNESGDKEAATKTADGQDGSGSAASVIVGDRKDGADPKEFSENVLSSPQSKNENSEPQAPPNDVETDKLNDEESPTDTPNSGRKRPNENSEAKENDDNEPLPKLPLKKARSAYFIFADMKREELKQLVRLFIFTVAVQCFLILHWSMNSFLFLFALNNNFFPTILELFLFRPL